MISVNLIREYLIDGILLNVHGLTKMHTTEPEMDGVF